jgi:hypothetical protein
MGIFDGDVTSWQRLAAWSSFDIFLLIAKDTTGVATNSINCPEDTHIYSTYGYQFPTIPGPPKNPEMTSATSSSQSSSLSSAQPSASAGNPSNTVDNLILLPRAGETVPYGQTYIIEWRGTTSGNISVYCRTLPSTSLGLIPDCQNTINYPGSINTCPWVVTPSTLPADSHSGFEIVLVWNSTAEGRQGSPEFGVAGGSSLPSSAVTTSSVPTPTSLPATTPHSKSSSLALGVGLGLGIPLLLLLFIAACVIRRRGRRKPIAPRQQSPQKRWHLAASAGDAPPGESGGGCGDLVGELSQCGTFWIRGDEGGTVRRRYGRVW